MSILRDRLYQALGSNLIGIDAPPFPFEKINILPEGVQPAHSAQQTQPLQSSYPTQQIPAAQPAYAQPQQHPSKQLYQPASKQRQTLQKQQEEQIHQQNVHQVRIGL